MPKENYLEGLPSLSREQLRRAIRSCDDLPDVEVAVYAIAAEIRRRRPRDHYAETLRTGQLHPTAELRSMIEDLLRRGESIRSIARIHRVRRDLVRKVARRRRERIYCRGCGAALVDRFAGLSRGPWRMLAALVEAAPWGLMEPDWLAATGRKKSGKWRTSRGELVGEGLVQRDGDHYYATDLATAPCVACASRAVSGEE